MELKNAIEKILDGQAVLFAGSGFSHGAKNKFGSAPDANALKETLLIKAGLPKNSQYNLETISNYFQRKKSSEELISLLRQQYNIVSVAEHHKNIVKLPWKRIYTTNYDQVIEIASRESDSANIITPITVSDPYDEHSKHAVCIHLNGYIERLNKDNINNEFKLTDHSYSCDTLIGNRWFELMSNDFDAASIIIIIGYSMQFDIDIKRLLSDPNISPKVIFIDAPDIDEIAKELLMSYGTCFSIGIEEFSKKVVEISTDYVPSQVFSFKCFRYMYRETLTTIPPSYEEIVQFYTEGKGSDRLLAKDASGCYQYILQRKALNYFLTTYKNSKVFIALSNLGNGKTIFAQMVENELRKDDTEVYTYIHRYDSLDREIEQICNSSKRCVVIIDNYPGHLDILNKFARYGYSNITFLLTARNGVNLMFCKQLENALHIDAQDIRPIYLNQLQPPEIKELSALLENNYLETSAILEASNCTSLEDFIVRECNSAFSSLLLKLFEASTIKEKLKDLYSGLENTENKQVKQVIIFSLLKNISNYDLNFHEILDLFHADYIALKRNDIEFIPEIFEDGDEYNSINVRSSVISATLVQTIIQTNDIIETMKEAFFSADKKCGKTYQELQKSMVSHSQFLYFTSMKDEREKLILIENFYNDIRNTNFAKDNPFFWEQFASAYIDMKKFDMVRKCIETALVAAKKIPGFIPFQVKTVQGRYFAEKCYDDVLNTRISAGDAINEIKKATDAILQYFDDPKNNQYYVFKVVKLYPKIFDNIKTSLNKRELSIYIEICIKMSKKMEFYLSHYEYSQYTDKIKTWMNQVQNSITEARTLSKSK